jgi:hypothetical protein
MLGLWVVLLMGQGGYVPQQKEGALATVESKDWMRQVSQNKISTIGFSLRNQHSPKESDVPMQVSHLVNEKEWYSHLKSRQGIVRIRVQE